MTKSPDQADLLHDWHELDQENGPKDDGVEEVSRQACLAKKKAKNYSYRGFTK